MTDKITPQIKKQFLEKLSTSLDIDSVIKDLELTKEDASEIFKSLIGEIPEAKPGIKKPVPSNNKIELVAYVDGGARGNPGEAGAGAYICDRDGNCVKKLKKYLGVATNNVAEYEALLMALKEARSMGAVGIKVFADSELVVKQVMGDYRVKNAALKEIYTKVVSYAREFDDFEIRHIPREKNKEADALANKAMDEKG